MTFKIDITTSSLNKEIKDKCLAAVQEVLEAEGGYFGAGYSTEEGLKQGQYLSGSGNPSNERFKVVADGIITFSFGKNGMGLTDEITRIGKNVEEWSKENHVYIEDAFIDAVDDVYTLKFRVVPHDRNAYLTKDDNSNNTEPEGKEPDDSPQYINFNYNRNNIL